MVAGGVARSETITVGVVGAGLIGGSIVRACLAAGIRVLVTDRDPTVVDRAAAAGAVPADLPRLRAEAEVVLLGVPPDAVAGVWETWLATPGPGGGARRSLVLDVASVKAPVVAGLAARGLPVDAHDTAFLLSHPMAGREATGWTAADGELFHGATWILGPAGHLTGAELVRCLRVVEAFGAAVCFMEPAFHDRFAAVTSHLPHVLAFAFQRLVDELDTTGWRRFSGGSLRDVLRISSSDPELWTQILAGNAEQLAPLLRDLAARLEGFDASTDVAAGQPRPLPPAPPAERLAVPLDAPLGGAGATLAATGERALHLTAWTVDLDAGRLEVTLGTPLASDA